MPQLDLILAVDDLKAFHHKNMAKTMNQKDYTYMARVTHGMVVTFFQDKGARVHFNHMALEDTKLIELTSGQ